jgi:hypothetical protein
MMKYITAVFSWKCRCLYQFSCMAVKANWLPVYFAPIYTTMSLLRVKPFPFLCKTGNILRATRSITKNFLNRLPSFRLHVYSAAESACYQLSFAATAWGIRPTTTTKYVLVIKHIRSIWIIFNVYLQFSYYSFRIVSCSASCPISIFGHLYSPCEAIMRPWLAI